MTKHRERLMYLLALEADGVKLSSRELEEIELLILYIKAAA